MGLRGDRWRHNSSVWAETEIFQALFIVRDEGRPKKAAFFTRVLAGEIGLESEKSVVEMELLRVQPFVREGWWRRLTLHGTTMAMPAKN